MDLQEKHDGWAEIFWSSMIIPSLDGEDAQGTNIPAQEVTFPSMAVNMGDGTINMSHLLQYLYVCRLNGISCPTTIHEVLLSLRRLSVMAREIYADIPCVRHIGQERGFFMRDDVDPLFNGLWKSVKGAMAAWSVVNEDPCYSPFVSQDQVWNLSPILYRIGRDGIDDTAMEIGLDINRYIKDNGYTIYNPYLSWIRHFHNYLPSLSGIEPWDREEDRIENFKYTEKVKRGANNWYYSGGTSANVDMFSGKEKYRGTLRTWLYKGIVLFLDRIWFTPFMERMGVSPKVNSFYCYAATSGIWYDKRFKKRLAKRFNESLKEDEPFEPNVAFLACDHSDIDWEGVKEWLEGYDDPVKEGTVESPITFMYVYQWFNYHNS